MNLKHLLSALTLVGLVASHCALAAPITVTYNGSARLGNASGVGFQTGTIYPGPEGASSANVSIGGIHIGVSSGSILAPGSYDAWCVDILNWLLPSAQVELGGPTQLTSTLGDAQHLPFNSVLPGTRVNDLLSLADVALASVNTQVESAAFQMAVWAITYGRQYNGKYRVSDNGADDNTFRIGTATNLNAAQSQANAWLDLITSSPSSTHTYGLFYLYDDRLENGRTQDLVIFTSGSGGTVPEPGSLALLGAGLLGAFAIRRRKSGSLDGK